MDQVDYLLAQHNLISSVLEMDNLDRLSDDELRVRLLQYGFANLPITQTTRKTLIKKLRNHLAQTSSNLRQTTSLATRYSSAEEDSDNVNSKKADSVKTRRTRMSVSGSPGGINVVNQHIMPPPLFTSLSQPISKTTPPLKILNRSGINSSGGKKSSVFVSPVIINDSDDDDIDLRRGQSRAFHNNSSRKTSHRTISTDLYTTLDSSQRALNGTNGNDQDDVDDSNTTSEYTKRLMQFREGNIQRQSSNMRNRSIYTNKRSSDFQPVSENDIVFHAEPSMELTEPPLALAIKNFIQRLDAAYGFKQTFVPMVLVTFLIVFFLLIIFAYFSISPSIENILNPSTTLYLACGQGQESDASYACIEEQNLESALTVLKFIAPELQARALAQRCGDKSKSISSIMCVKDIWHFLSDNQPQNHFSGLDVIKDVHNIEYLVDRNKQWGIQNVDANGAPISLDDVLKLRAHQAECFTIPKPKLPITCTIYNKIQTFFFIIGSLAILSIIFFVVRKFYQFILQVKEKRRQQVDQIIREICSTLMEKTKHEKENAAVVLNHLRDKIISASKRSELANWQEAISYLEKNDSRVHFCLETINGEDIKVIRWIEDVKTSPSGIGSQATPQQVQQQQRFSNSRYSQQTDGRSYATLKKWMGSAFDKSNKIKDPPTNCLKIRQMFERYEVNNANLQTIIQDTILHKLRDKNCKIYDIQLDMKTCCVYVKCASCADAGIVHEEMNGWWLDAGLVVVKFLKQDKYHQRFPSSINACTPLHLSSMIYVTNNDSALNGHEDFFDDELDDDDFE